MIGGDRGAAEETPGKPAREAGIKSDQIRKMKKKAKKKEKKYNKIGQI